MTHSAKKPKVDSEDWISALPDVVLHQILSFLELREAMETSILSKRWRYLWRFVPTLDFGSWHVDEYPRIPTIVSDSLSMFDDRAEIKKFRIELFNYVDSYVDTDRIDSWIQFAVKHKVKELCLNIFTADHTTDIDSSLYCYNLHRFLADCGTLEVLRSGYCMLNLTSSVSFRSLKVLDLFYLWLPNLDTSGCPVLEV